MDGVHSMGPGAIMFTLIEHFRLTGDMDWLKANAPRMRANAQWIYDSSGELLKLVGTGTVADITLPDGTRFHTAGRTDFLNPPIVFTIVPTNGGSGDIAALCAAFAP